MFFIVLPITTPFSNYVIDKYGMGISVKIGIIFTVLGSWSKVFINTFFEIVIIG
jgi:hypothetical protein